MRTSRITTRAGLIALGALAAMNCGEGGSDHEEPAALCSDGLCTGGETAESCSEDCAPAAECGDGVCDQAGGECGSCSADCSADACEVCGNGVCLASAESCASCAEDCGDCLECGAGGSVEVAPVENAAICDFLDPSACLLPFPSNFFLRDDTTTDTQKRLNLALQAMPKNTAGVPMRPDDFNDVDGFSPVATLLLRASGRGGVPLDLEKSRAPTLLDMGRSLELDSPIVVIDAETGERQAVWAEFDVGAASLTEQALLVHPAGVFKHGRRYIAAFRNLIDRENNPIEPGATFRLYRDCQSSTDTAVEARRGAMEDIFSRLARAGVKRSELFLAWDFTIASRRDQTERILHMRDRSFEALGSGKIPTSLVQRTDPSLDEDPKILRVVSGYFEVPRYLSTHMPGARMTYGPDGKPAAQLTPYYANFTCVIPRAAVDPQTGKVTPSRLALYGHQQLKTAAEVQSSHIKTFAATHNVTFCSTDLIGMAESDLPHIALILADFSQFPALPERVQQGYLNYLHLGRLMKASNGFAEDPNFRWTTGEPLIAPGELFYFGEDQGGVLGVGITAVAQDWTRSVLNVPGIGYSLLVPRSRNSASFLDVARVSYPAPFDVLLAFQIGQILWDRGEGSGYAEHATDDPLPGSPAHQVLIHEVFGDHSSPNVLSQMLARTVGAHVHTPALAPGRALEQTPFWAIAPLDTYPFEGSAHFVWDSGAPPPDPANRPPQSGLDPHGVPGRSPLVHALSYEFGTQKRIAADPCGGAPCTAE